MSRSAQSRMELWVSVMSMNSLPVWCFTRICKKCRFRTSGKASHAESWGYGTLSSPYVREGAAVPVGVYLKKLFLI